MNHITLPKHLTKYGFDPKGEKIQIDSLRDIRAFIRDKLVIQKNINLETSSYGLKHIAEREVGRYVGNGELIAAMILEGYDHVVSHGLNYPYNAHFNVSERSIKDCYKYSKPLNN